MAKAAPSRKSAAHKPPARSKRPPKAASKPHKGKAKPVARATQRSKPAAASKPGPKPKQQAPAAKAPKPRARSTKAPSRGTRQRTVGAAATPRAEAHRAATPARAITLRVNGRVHALEVGRDVEPNMTLAYVLRERLGITGPKVPCDEGACGACTVLLDGKAVLSCMMLAIEADGHAIVTIEGLAKADPVVEAFACQCEPGYGTAMQCGICTPGFVMAARALLDENPKPTMDEIKEALSGNLCRCGCYAAIAQAVQHASDKLVATGGAQ
jgi:carbon-monoxide dehydrogenase small subunit